jgi:hypothetical protein
LERHSGWFLLAILAGAACRRDPAVDRRVLMPPFARGDVVVVERAAAEFFEARVLSVSGTSLKVQTSADGEPVAVATSDAYRAGQSKGPYAPGAAAICKLERARWEGCRILDGGGRLVNIELTSGETRAIEPVSIVLPGPVTVLDIERSFDVLSARRRFAQAALAAGHPRRPGGWTPEPHEPLLARRNTEWYSAHAAALLADGGERVVWEGTSRGDALPASYVVPVPPFEHTFTRGDFALVRPTTVGQAWERVRIEGLGPDEAVIVGADGQRRRVPARGLVPLAVGQ